jgi:hypothetical protein
LKRGRASGRIASLALVLDALCYGVNDTVSHFQKWVRNGLRHETAVNWHGVGADVDANAVEGLLDMISEAR